MHQNPFASVLVANRGEIAARIFRTAKRLNMRTIAVYSDADRDALFVSQADEAHLIGPSLAEESYLRIDKIIDAAKVSGAACIHPGYGFLSERAEFADACAAAGIVLVGPPASAIRAMGLKDSAKALAELAGVPIVPGYHGARQATEFLQREADKIGYPVLIKAIAGGGGKGMRRVDSVEEFVAALASARREAESAFGDSRVLIEKYLLAPRHIEIQVFADAHGNTVSLFERDCSLQRRHQKVIEEAPAPGLPAEMREAMGKAAVQAAKAVSYVGAGTVEFIADTRDGLKADRFYFMEMNTRLQVEHTVTEAVTGLDLVELQFRIAAGEPLPFAQAELAIHGHAVEARLYAEDPANGFLPSTGKLWALGLPVGDGIRVDAGVRAGDVVTPFYDPMIAKVIAHGETRDEALDQLTAALERTIVAGPTTNIAFLIALCNADRFRECGFDTGFIDRNLAALTASSTGRDAVAVRLGVRLLIDRARASLAVPRRHPCPWSVSDAFQLGEARRQTMPVIANGERIDVDIVWPGPRISFGGEEDRGIAAGATVVPTDRGIVIVRDGRQTKVASFDPSDVDLNEIDEGGTIKAPMHGRLVATFVKVGDRVVKGQRLAILEAMKMEHSLSAPRAGEILEVGAEVGAQVPEGARLIVLTAEESTKG
jgi:3-methylcrotonyl-CoA carboxylase alpha subunit